MALGTVKKNNKGPVVVLGTAAFIAFLAFWEGGKEITGNSTVYADKLAGNIPTVCNGLTKSVTNFPLVIGEVWTAEKCALAERTAIIHLQFQLLQCFHQTPPQSVFDAASSHAWNFGVGTTCKSSAMMAWNTGEWALGCKRISHADSGKRIWSYVRTGKMVDGKPEMKFVQGLANRRDAEVKACLSGL